jgi:hypothetical protein
MDVSNSSGTSPVAAERKLVTVLVCEIDAPAPSSVEHEVSHGDRQAAGHLRRG